MQRAEQCHTGLADPVLAMLMCLVLAHCHQLSLLLAGLLLGTGLLKPRGAGAGRHVVFPHWGQGFAAAGTERCCSVRRGPGSRNSAVIAAWKPSVQNSLCLDKLAIVPDHGSRSLLSDNRPVTGGEKQPQRRGCSAVCLHEPPRALEHPYAWVCVCPCGH